MKKEEFTYLSSDRKTKIHAIRWIPDGEIRGVLQISHGMVEYVDRYDNFAAYLAGNGFYVTGNDHLGHGASVISEDDHGYFGHPDGNKDVISDMHQLRELTLSELEKTRTEEKDLPYFMLGHSMGSFLLRQYLTIYGEGLAGAVIMGTGFQPAAALAGGKALCRILAAVRGWKGHSELINNMAIGGYGKKIKNARTEQDWLSKDEDVVDAYRADPWCTYMFTLNGYYQMFSGMQTAHDPKMIGRTQKDLPILIVSGSDDPVGDFGKGVKKVRDMYRDLGFTDVKMKLYHGDRHEILNELDKELVYGDLLEWMQTRMMKI